MEARRPMRAPQRRNRRFARLVVLPDAEHHDARDFAEIAARVRARAPDVRVRVHAPRRWRSVFRHLTGRRPLTVVALRHWGDGIRPRRGRCFQGAEGGKAQQYERMEAAGLATIPWARWTPETTLDPARFGAYVIAKPDVGARGRGVHLRSARRLRYDAEKHGREAWIVQRFVHTGPYPVVHRVTTFFGRPVLHLRSELSQANACEDPEAGTGIAGHNPVASSRRAKVTLVRDEEIERYASRVARAAYPEVPVLALDVLRDRRDGGLHCCECNPWGRGWHFSSVLGRSVQQEHGLDFRAQLGAFDVAAEELVRVARETGDDA